MRFTPAGTSLSAWASKSGPRAIGASPSGLRCATLAAWIWAAGIAPAEAHHSYAMFDHSKQMSLNGTVAKVEWKNPHVFVWLYVQRRDGHYEPYSFESGSVSTLKRNGWSADTLRVGEKITVHYFPLRDGGKGGSLIKAVHANGRVDTADPNAPGGTSYAPPPGGNK